MEEFFKINKFQKFLPTFKGNLSLNYKVFLTVSMSLIRIGGYNLYHEFISVDQRLIVQIFFLLINVEYGVTEDNFSFITDEYIKTVFGSIPNVLQEVQRNFQSKFLNYKNVMNSKIL